MTRLLAISCKSQLTRVFLQESLKSLQCHNLAECRVNCFRSRLGAKDSRCFVSELRIQSD